MKPETVEIQPSTAARYGFRDRLRKEFPSQIVVDVTEACNLACIHCPHPEFKQSENYAGRYLDPALNEKMVREVREYSGGCTAYIRYTSEGEPLVHPNAYEMIEDAVRNSGVFVTLTTNGTIMNEKRTRRLLDAGVHMIDISIDAFKPETYARIRVNGRLETTQANVLRLLRWRRESGVSTKVVISFVEQEHNAGEADDFERFWSDAGADRVIVRRRHSAAGSVKPIALQLWKGASGRYPCLYPWERITLNPRGELAFCPQDWVHGSAIADYRSTTIRETWSGEFYQRLRDAHLSNLFAAHPFCGGCPDWMQTRWPGDGRSYADMVEEFLHRGDGKS